MPARNPPLGGFVLSIVDLYRMVWNGMILPQADGWTYGGPFHPYFSMFLWSRHSSVKCAPEMLCKKIPGMHVCKQRNLRGGIKEVNPRVCHKQIDIFSYKASQTVTRFGHTNIFGQLEHDKGQELLFAHNLCCHE